jgi:pimeloyl-ACP methyl ester carboxylesterase
MQEHAIIANDVSIYYRIEGAGEPVILLHGFGEDGAIWNGIAHELREHHLLIIPDLPGSGKSTSNLQDMSIESLAEHVKLIVDKEGLTSFSLIGHSMGGYIALAFAEKYEHMLKSLGLFHSSAFADGEEKKDVRRKSMDFIRQNGSAKFLKQSTPNLFSEEFRNDHPEVVEELISRYSNFSPGALVSYTEAMMNRPDRTDVLKKFSKPVLFIMGEHDTAVPLEQGLKQCSIPEFSYIYIAIHSGHMGMLEEPEFCLNALQEFLSA